MIGDLWHDRGNENGIIERLAGGIGEYAASSGIIGNERDGVIAGGIKVM